VIFERKLRTMNASSLKTQPVTLPVSAPTPIDSAKRHQREFRADGPSQPELAFLWFIAAVCFIIVLTRFESYGAKVIAFADNAEYISAAQAIQHWDLGSTQTRQGWGLSYLIALLSIFHLSDRVSLLLISMASSLGSILLVRSLWGPWIAAFFAILNFSWIQASFLGSSEPLFLLLLFASFWCSRKDRVKEQWPAASLLAALATVTRAVGIFALIALGLTLLRRKEYRKLSLCTALAAFIGVLYLLPFWITFHDPLYQFHRRANVGDWDSGHLFTWPLHDIVVSYMYYRGPWTNVILTAAWIGLAVIGFCWMGVKLYRDRLRERPYELIFAMTYLMFLFCYNSLEWARWDFPRFVIPTIPLLLLSVYKWLPKSRYVVYPLCVASSILAACSAIGIQNVIAALSHKFS
jgi:hypothetical protein